MTTTAPVVDVNVPRFNQAIVAVATGLAFILNTPWLVVVVFVVLALSALGGPRAAPLTQLYVRVVRPLIQPEGPADLEPAAPPRFAQTLGAVVLGLAVIAFVVGWNPLGWTLTLIVTALAALAAATRICVGCIIHERIVQ